MYTEITVLHPCSTSDLLCVKKHLFKGTLQEMLVSKIVVKIILKIYGENSPREDLSIVIYVWYLCSLFNPESFNFTNRH